MYRMDSMVLTKTVCCRIMLLGKMTTNSCTRFPVLLGLLGQNITGSTQHKGYEPLPLNIKPYFMKKAKKYLLFTLRMLSRT